MKKKDIQQATMIITLASAVIGLYIKVKQAQRL